MGGDKNQSIARIKELTELLNRASEAYYRESREIMSNYEYDKLYDELLELEEKTGILLSSSPTHKVGYEVLSSLPKQEHETPMLSLDKTKDVQDLKSWMGEQKVLLSWKLDGLTIVLRYREGKLADAVTRGNGSVGELITENARNFQNLPLKIDFQGELVLRGEAIIKYSDFEKINAEIEDIDAKYKNPRNLCSGSVRQLNPNITKRRMVYFYAFGLVGAEGEDFQNSAAKQMEFLAKQGFDVVEWVLTDAEQIEKDVQTFSDKIEGFDLPSDGLVLLMDDIAYGQGLGTTSKFPRNAMAFKWNDEIRESKLICIEWSPSRTGLINPIALFEPVELEGTRVSRASVHNLSMVESLALGEGDRITVYKANMIIPQIAENLSRSGGIKAPASCPSCGKETMIRKEAEVKTLYCTNPECPVKHSKGFALLTSRDALNIEGLSEMTLEKFLAAGLIREAADIFKIAGHKESIVKMEGFGERSYEKLCKAVEKARHTTLPRLIYSLGIAGIGLSNAKVLSRAYQNDINLLRKAKKEELVCVEGIGEVLAASIEEYFRDEAHQAKLDRLLSELVLESANQEIQKSGISGKVFVITGKTEKFSGRKELQELIESYGGRVSSSVSANTSYLINNDSGSNSSKNKKAKELGVSIITEEEFLKLLEEGEDLFAWA
ncbi:MAG: NAD-dependent DNA ligase LigA [Johnsonella sp.]|nr:NAD-dependent DNA ligase LigA [Johnsonella sp.]